MSNSESSPDFAKVRKKIPRKSHRRLSKKKSKTTKNTITQYTDPDWPKGLHQRCINSVPKGEYFYERVYKKNRIVEPLGRIFEAASEKANKFNREIAYGYYKPEFKSREGLTISKFFTLYLDERTDLRPKTIQKYRGRAKHFETFMYDCYPRISLLTQITNLIANEYVSWRQNQQVTRCGWQTPTTPTNKPHPDTVREDITRLGTMFKWAVLNKYIESNPFENVTVPGKQKSNSSVVTRYLEESKIKSLLKAAKEYDQRGKRAGGKSTFQGMMYNMTYLYILTGLRKNELIYLPWDNVEFNWGESGRLHIREFTIKVTLKIELTNIRFEKMEERVSKLKPNDRLFTNHQSMKSIIPSNYLQQEKDNLLKLKVSAWDSDAQILNLPTNISWVQKTNEGSVPLLPEAKKILLEQKDRFTDSEFVFPHSDGGPLRSDYWEQFKILLKMANLPREIRVHDLRHTFGTTLRENGVSIEVIMGLMRHANIEETMRYAKYTDTQGAKAITCLDGFGI